MIKRQEIQMGILDPMVGRCFRDEAAGRAVVFPGTARKRGYLVSSSAEERKIAAFIKMYFCAHVSIFILGYLLAYEWSMWVVNELGRPAAHPVRSVGIFLGIYAVVVGLPYLLLWQSYKRSIFSFVSAQDEIVVSTKPPPQPRALVFFLLALGALLVLVGLAVFWMTRSQ
jgi:hypothetical protein